MCGCFCRVNSSLFLPCHEFSNYWSNLGIRARVIPRKTIFDSFWHQNLVSWKLRDVNVRRLALTRRKRIEGDPFDGGFCFSLIENFFHVRWFECFLPDCGAKMYIKRIFKCWHKKIGSWKKRRKPFLSPTQGFHCQKSGTFRARQLFSAVYRIHLSTSKI